MLYVFPNISFTVLKDQNLFVINLRKHFRHHLHKQAKARWTIGSNKINPACIIPDNMVYGSRAALNG